MNRRDTVVALFALGAVAAPFISAAQSPTVVARIGYLQLSVSSFDKARLAMFKEGLRELGYVEGKNFVIEWRSAEGKYERLPTLAAELVGLQMNVIVAAGGTPSALAAKNATKTIPIVFPTAADPVALGIVASLARPGGNVTGLSQQSAGTVAKRLQLLKEIVPHAKRIAVLTNPSNSSAVPWIKETQAATKQLAVTFLFIEARAPAEFDDAFAEIARKQADGLLIFEDVMFAVEAPRLGSLAAKWKLPTMGRNSVMPEAGALASYGVNTLEMYRRAAAYVDKILKGAKPGDLPIEQPTTFEFVINIKTAKALGITIPPKILLRADRVIE